MALADELKAGDMVVVRGLGLGKVKSRGANGLVVRLGSGSDDDVAEVRPEKIDALVRRPMAAAEASEVLQLLARKEGDPDPRGWGEQYVELQKVLKTGAPKEQAVLLQRLYRMRNPSTAQQRVLDAYEDALLGELAHSLKKKIGPLRSQLHRGQPAFGYQAPDRDDDRPIAPLEVVPAGWEAVVSFRVFSGRMAIGEYPVSENDGRTYGDCRATLVQPCEDGEWFALSREGQDGDGGWEYAVVFRPQVARLADLLGAAVRLGAVSVEGGSVHFVDEEVRDDKRYQREMETGGDDLLRRGFHAQLGGDGATEISGATGPGGERYVLFHVAA